MSGISLSNVDVTGVTAGWDQVIIQDTDATHSLALGNTKLETIANWAGGGNVDATSASFYNASSGTLLDASVLRRRLPDRGPDFGRHRMPPAWAGANRGQQSVRDPAGRNDQEHGTIGPARVPCERLDRYNSGRGYARLYADDTNVDRLWHPDHYPSGTVAATSGARTYALPSQSQVDVSIPSNGASTTASISTGTFTAYTTLDTHNLHVVGGPYAVDYTYSDQYKVQFNPGAGISITGSNERSAAITARAVSTASIIGNPTKTYNANMAATLGTGNFSISNLVNGDNFTITQTVGTYNTKDVTTATTVKATLGSATFSPQGTTLASDYTFPASATGPGTINAGRADNQRSDRHQALRRHNNLGGVADLQGGPRLVAATGDRLRQPAGVRYVLAARAGLRVAERHPAGRRLTLQVTPRPTRSATIIPARARTTPSRPIARQVRSRRISAYERAQQPGQQGSTYTLNLGSIQSNLTVSGMQINWGDGNVSSYRQLQRHEHAGGHGAAHLRRRPEQLPRSRSPWPTPWARTVTSIPR